MRLTYVLFIAIVACQPLAAESLWKAETLADGNLYADAVARRRGDLLTVQIQESVSVSSNAKTERKRDNSIEAKISMVPGADELPATEGESSVNRLPAVKASSSKSFKGEGKAESGDTVQALITVQVADVLDNGVLVIRGTREVTVGKDKKTILLSGMVRPADISSANTVMSEKVHSFQVSIVGEGPLARSQDEGFLGQLIDLLWPF